MHTILDEIFAETTTPCTHSNCTCSRCQASKQRKNQVLIKELGWAVNREEEYELSQLFNKLKGFAARSVQAAKGIYRKAKPMIAAADIVRRIIFPSTEPIPQLKDTAAYIEQDKRRRTQDRIEQAQAGKKSNVLQKPPDRELTLLQEIFMEAEEEMAKGLWGCSNVRCNVYPDPQATVANTNCPKRVIGISSGHSSYSAACLAAQKDANSKVPQGCVKRHCNCRTKCKKQ